MTDKIYGNSFALQTFSSMIKSGRIPHSYLIYGEKGLGKKTIASYLAQLLLCENGGETPCGSCKACRLAQNKIHPDIIYPEQSGKLNTYTVETCRGVCTDAYIAPNNGSRKIYIFADSDSIQLPAQNALLKIVEEPPEPVYFIFTAQSKDAFLPTILSRVTSIGVSAVTEDLCREALTARNYEENRINEAVKAFCGNIGMCVEYMENPTLQAITALTKRAVDSIIIKDEYSLLAVFSASELKERDSAISFLKMLDVVIRDSSVLRYNEIAEVSGCYKTGASRLSEKISVKSAMRIHNALDKAAADIKSNVSTVLVMSALCGEIIDS